MATLYETIYEAFFDKVRDYDLVDMAEADAKSYLHRLLSSSVVKFNSNLEKEVLFLDDENECFTEELKGIEIDVITDFMVEYWTRPYYYNNELLRNVISTKDFTQYSNANLLNAICTAYKTSHERAESNMNKYTFAVNDVRDLL